jgi:hypothetical protein
MKARVQGVTFTLSDPAEHVVRMYQALLQDIIHLDFEQYQSDREKLADISWWDSQLRDPPVKAEYDVDQLQGLRSRRNSQELGGPDDGE